MQNRVVSWLRTRSWQEWVVYGGLALLVMGPLLGRGFVLTLDMVWVPHLKLPSEADNTYVFFALLHWLHVVVPADILQKFVLLGILVGAGIGAHRLTQEVDAKAVSDNRTLYRLDIYPFAAGLFYAINPFTYERFMAGQYLVLLGYALLPFCVRTLWKLQRAPSWSNAMALLVTVLAIGFVSIHTLGFVVIIGLVAIMCAAVHAGLNSVKGVSVRKQTSLLRAALLLGGVGAAFVVLSWYWLWPFLAGHSAVSQQISSFGEADLHAFATLGSSFVGKLGNVLQLQGFWQETTNLFRAPQTAVPGWGIIMIGWWALVACGLAWLWKHHRSAALFWSVLLVCSLWLATGISQQWLSVHVPLLSGYREPQKFVAIVALCYAVLGAIGVRTMLQKWRRLQPFMLTASMVAPLLLAVPMLWGFGGQLHATAYPDDWQRADKLLSADRTQFHTLFLPWHLYMYLGFADRLVANPAPQFFAVPLTASQDPELGELSTPARYMRERAIESSVLPGAASSYNLGAQLAPFGIKYIVMAKEFDYQKYEYLAAQSDLVMIYDGPTMSVYQNKLFTGVPPWPGK